MSCNPRENGERDALLRTPPNLPAEACKTILRVHHEYLRQYLNLHEIIPFLNRRKLLSAVDLASLTDTRYTLENRVDTLVDGLMKSGLGNFLLLFIECLRESSATAGRSHSELADLISKDYLQELERHSKL